ncbi:MAG TPA: hypothetical protein VG367_00380 [Mucilaginibacter sp.]|jgi:hypothetical protein|nr:hypothetical protein [Mucilaginibacter sp.]
MNNFLMTDDIIISQLKEKETKLTAELNKVRLALSAFLSNDKEEEDADTPDELPGEYAAELTYSNKILFVLSQYGKAMLVSDIVEAIHAREPSIDKDKLQKNVSYNLSMLAKYSRIRKHPFNRMIKYSL